ncbi:deoxycytidine triphosphate deaminase [Streptomyces sp. MST-110588]|uniref:dCTP deaminase n=1 Tax=Streptomyces sp. MST-110588 TaxID=2833628 RepID=UPI001F5CCCAA|nr:deoxycytidine triphosphate deaminase [Streptomyces sp. MST-110588]UNO39180.1 deoxycytidine triphosphate deaminase [Streptomyces sp. MST-110588]
MILTGEKIASAVADGDIVIEPFESGRISPNAYDWRLGDRIRVCDTDLDAAAPTPFTEKVIPAEGMVLRPGVLYLGVTHERTHSERYAQMINGDHTVGGLGIWVHVSAPLGHVGHAIRWTLEIRVARTVRIYPYMTFGKIVFLDVFGSQSSYQHLGQKYTSTGGIDISRLYEELV